MAVLMTPPYLQFFDDNGIPLNGGKVYTYTATGTFTVPKTTYTTAAGNIAQTNPIILDASGRPTLGNGSIWLSGTYDFKVTDSFDNIIETTLNVTAFTALPPSSDAYFESFSGNGTQTAFTTSQTLGADEKAIYVWVDNGLQQNVTNGTFSSDTGWTKGAGWTIATGTAIATGAISTALSQTSAVTLIASEAYVLTYTVTRSAGGIIPSIGGTNGVERTASGTYTEVISCGTNQILAFTGNAFTGTLDNISITVANPKGYDIQNPANYTINGTSLIFATAPAIGTGNIYVSAPSLLVGAASSAAADAAASAANAAASAVAAATSEANAALSAAKLSGTSTTSLLIGTGSKVFTTQASKFFTAGQFLLVTSDADPTNYMHGQVTSYSSTTLTLNVIDVGGLGIFADWTIRVSGTRGTIGATGSISDLSGVPSGTVAIDDKLIFDDVDAAHVTKSCTVQDILNLATPVTWVLIQTQTASTSSSIDFTTGITSTYKRYVLDVIDLVPATDGAIITLVVSENAGGTWKVGSSDYEWAGFYINSASGVTSDTDSDNTNIHIIGTDGVGNATGESMDSTISVFNPAGTTSNKRVLISATCENPSGQVATFVAGASYKGSNAAINGFRVIASAGAITSGTFKLYGVL